MQIAMIKFLLIQVLEVGVIKVAEHVGWNLHLSPFNHSNRFEINHGHSQTT